MIDVDVRDFLKLGRDLTDFERKAVPYATRQVLNDLAFDSRRKAQTRIANQFVNRNRFTQQSVRVERAQGLNVRTMESRVGSVADYADEMEQGGTKRAKGKSGTPIPTAYASGQSGQPATRLPRRANKLSAIHLKGGKIKAANEKQKLLIMVNLAVETGERFIFTKIGKRVGIYRVVGGVTGQRKTCKGVRGSGWPKGARLRMVWDLSHKSVPIPRNPWLLPAVNDAAPLAVEGYRRALTEQVARYQLFKSRQSS